MDSVKIYAIMVIYNKELKEAPAYSSLKELKEALVVCDNSTEEYHNGAVAESDMVSYISMDGNKGLSYAYNRGIEYIFKTYSPKDSDYICIFDDDTVVGADYFTELAGDLGGIMLPVVKDKLGIMSPVCMKGLIARRIKTADECRRHRTSELSGINSGMAVKAGIYRNYRYDEEMFLDYIDHKFIMDMRRRGIYPQIMNTCIKQDFSATQDDRASELARFAIQKRDLRIFYRKHKLLYYYVVIKKHIKLFIKYRDFSMLLG